MATAEEPQEYVKSRVGPCKCPRTATVQGGLPDTATGKILKRELAG